MKKVFSVILAITLLFSMCIPAFAVEETKASNYNGNPVIIVRGIDFAGLTGNEIVFDAYCGIGVMSLMLAKKAKFVYGW